MSEMRKRLMVVVDYVGNCPRCGKERCTDSESLADELCHGCRMYILKHG